MIALYYQIKILISFWYRQGMNPQISFVQILERQRLNDYTKSRFNSTVKKPYLKLSHPKFHKGRF